ncbi:MAG: GNAT family N-acetyltransferase [Candidatus Zixiibacteriota bacterium]
MKKIFFTTKKLVIREFNLDDLEDVHSYANDPEVCKYLTFCPNSIDKSKEYIQKNIAAQNTMPRTRYDLAIYHKKAEKVIGGIGLFIGDYKSAELGYILNKDFWGQGITTLSARILIEFGFEVLNLHRIWATCNIDNRASERVMIKCGMEKEGVLRDFLPIDGIWYDNFLYSIIENDKRQLPGNVIIESDFI